MQSPSMPFIDVHSTVYKSDMLSLNFSHIPTVYQRSTSLNASTSTRLLNSSIRMAAVYKNTPTPSSIFATNVNTNAMRSLSPVSSTSTSSAFLASTVRNASLLNTTRHIASSSGVVQAEGYSSTDIMLLFAFFLILSVGTMGNGYIYYYFGMKKKSKRSIPELLFSYLAVFDFIASIINPSIYIYFTFNRNVWDFGETLCKTTLTFGAVVTTISGGIFIIIAFDRERCIVFPFKSHFKPKTIKICVATAIVYAILMNFHYALNLKIFPHGQCTVGNVLLTSYWLPTIICFFIQDMTLIFVFAFTNMRIFNHIKSKDNTLELGALWGKRKKDSAKIIRLLVVLATVFFVLTLPRDVFLITHMMSWVVGRGIKITQPLNSAYYFIKVLHTANSCVNIFIYYHMHRGFRRHLNYHVLCFIYGTEPRGQAKFLDIMNTESSPNILRKIGSPIRGRSRSASREVATVDVRLIDEVNIGRKRTVNERRKQQNGHLAVSPLVQPKKSSNLLTVNMIADRSTSCIAEVDDIDVAV